jgi:hypothetical protein
VDTVNPSLKARKDHRLSKLFARRYRKALRPRQCWSNARHVLRDPDLVGCALYVEGWCCDRDPVGHVFPHGWLEMDGKVLDPTLPEDNDGLRYFAGLRFTAGEVKARVWRRREPLGGLPLGWSDPGAELKAYRHAFEEACAHADRESGGRPSPDIVESRRAHWTDISIASKDSIDPAMALAAMQAALRARTKAVQ